MTAPDVQRFRVIFANRQCSQPVNLRRLRPIVETLLHTLPAIQTASLGVSLLSAPQMTRLNERFLKHAGSTDAITFDYSEPGARNSKRGTDLHGEIFICVDEAIAQARRFRTTWQAELVRYLVHGILHLLGYDDRRPAARRKMKRAEDRLVRSLARGFDFRRLARTSSRPPSTLRASQILTRFPLSRAGRKLRLRA
jgi:probable rRNA maturation factor